MFPGHHQKTFAAVLILFLLSALPLSSSADHSWGNYHWARTSNPFTITLGDNLSPAWDSHLANASYDWSLSEVLDTTIVPGTTNPKNCRPTYGRVEVCNSKYGKNGWLGVTQIWLSSGHIVQGTLKLNDTYFNTAAYNIPAWKKQVMCHEVGHTFGLDHQDEDFNNTPLGTCMDYSSNPIPNQYPNAHDYEQLETIYGHDDSIAAPVPPPIAFFDADSENLDTPKQWGKLIRSSKQRRTELYELILGRGQKVYTFVIWANAAEK